MKKLNEKVNIYGISFMLVKQDLRCFLIILLQSDEFHDKINKSEFFAGIFEFWPLHPWLSLKFYYFSYRIE